MDKADYYVNRVEELAPGTIEAQMARNVNNKAHELHEANNDTLSD